MPISPEEKIQRLKLENAILRKHLQRKPDYRCTKCGHLVCGSGNWPCRICGKWHTWTGSFKWPDDTPQALEWIAHQEHLVNHFVEQMVDVAIKEKGE